MSIWFLYISEIQMMITKLFNVEKETLTFQNGKETVQRHKILCGVLLYFSWEGGGGEGGLEPSHSSGCCLHIHVHPQFL